LWVANRGQNFIWVVDTASDTVVNTIPLAGEVSDDPTPDLRAVSPNGSHVFEAAAPVSNVDAAGIERADVHAMTIRIR
jgi:YVTN family beta-propeller protein